MKILTVTMAILFAVILVGFAANIVNAAPKGSGRGANTECPNFVDANGDGINDNCPNGGTRPQDGTGAKRGKGGNGGPNPDCPNFVDENGDGVNDNCPNGGTRPQDGTGSKMRRGNRSNASGQSNVTQAPSKNLKIRRCVR